MGLLDMFGVGGGSVELVIPTTTLPVGSIVDGVVRFVGGSREQHVTAMMLKVTRTLSSKRHDEEQGWVTDTETDDLIPETAFSGAFSCKPNERHEFPFRLQIPASAAPTVLHALAYELMASANIDGELDPSKCIELKLVPNVLGHDHVFAVQAPAVLRFPETCSHCGAGLTPPPAGQSLVSCPFCHRTFQGIVG